MSTVTGGERAHEAPVDREIERQHQILSAITEALPDTVVVVDSKGRYRFVNSAFAQYAGRPADQIIGRSAIEVLGAEEVARRRPYMQRAFAGEAVHFVLDYPSAQGTSHLALSCIPLQVDGVIDGFVGVSRDITLQQREQQRLVHLAERDPLTGLLNRAGLERRVEQALWSGARMALLYIDLDHFKPVNDQFGHVAGDRLLQLFARRLGETVRGSDVVARLGGDEFAVLLAGVTDNAAAVAVAEKVLLAAQLPFEVDTVGIRISASIGVAMMSDGQGDCGWRELMARADGLLYRAKAGGRGRLEAQASEPPQA